MPVSDTAVTPVIDYEPPTRNIARCLPARQALPQAPRVPRPGPADTTAVAVPSPLPPQLRQAVVFADVALRRVLEVIDRRRPAVQLGSVLAPGLVESVLAVSRAVAQRSGVAVLRRMRAQPAGGDAAEVFGTYSRGERVHAIACRVEYDSGRWLVVALHIG
ncbi:hypothetical protein A5634_12610 [Mycobacterium asiaticum]|uniref:Alanine, arginine and proline rich protein n=1 Tax=Mycobacterium asiaticum TaxID=1790 RepID=A0A1A3NHM4_MYCAS|nr:Rv3235 family protein [Mycobacterium asiaticum]OBK20564.1 hypothetical protein A5634_12610 [Mycobacterium asiaticum]